MDDSYGWRSPEAAEATLRRGAAKTFRETGYSLVPVEPDVLYEVRAEKPQSLTLQVRRCYGRSPSAPHRGA
jgi:hypothetical protein